ncbi:MAG: aromatic amino acid lyase, partial [bacterium]
RCSHVADSIGAMTLEALLGTPSAFDDRIHQARRHRGQIQAANHLRNLEQGSEIRESHRFGDKRVQDAYCLRCMPQVHGAVRAALQHLGDLMEDETAAATDNPLVFAKDREVISGGNFHAAPLAYALDYAAIAMTDLLSISERRIDRLLNPDSSEGLPAFLAQNPGLESGLMMAHVTVAALLNECKVLSHPASVDSVPTSGGREDHVSMGMTSALKLRQIVTNVELGLSIELFAACEGIERRRPLKSSAPLEKLHAAAREVAAPLNGDRSLSDEFTLLAKALADGKFDSQLEPVWPRINS